MPGAQKTHNQHSCPTWVSSDTLSFSAMAYHPKAGKAMGPQEALRWIKMATWPIQILEEAPGWVWWLPASQL